MTFKEQIVLSKEEKDFAFERFASMVICIYGKMSFSVPLPFLYGDNFTEIEIISSKNMRYKISAAYNYIMENSLQVYNLLKSPNEIDEMYIKCKRIITE